MPGGGLWRPPQMLAAASLQRAAIFAWGLYQDATMVPKFTDVDYMVFTDAARYVAQGESPYLRDTYRYTPLLAWLLVASANWFFSFGKVLFVLGDLVAGMLAIDLLRRQGLSTRRACMYTSVWLLNPMVSTISTRGSSEGLLGALVVSMVWAVSRGFDAVAGLLAGVAVHFKIYPIVYIPTVVWALGPLAPRRFVNRRRVAFLGGAAAAFFALTLLMWHIYGDEYLNESWLYHLVRLDHRHNFSAYSTSLYYSLAAPARSPQLERWAFVPQLALSGVILPLAFARRNMLGTMFVQTFAFVTFNKVCTSQYFIWYIVLLPFFMPTVARAGPVKYVFAVLWVASQALWLRTAYQLEFLGVPMFYPQLFISTLLFFAVNVWGICLFIDWL